MTTQFLIHFSSLSFKANEQVYFPEDTEPPGATSADYYLSEAAKVSTPNLYLNTYQVKYTTDGQQPNNGECAALFAVSIAKQQATELDCRTIC